MPGLNKKNHKKGSKSQKKKGNKKGEIKDDVPAAAATASTNTITIADAAKQGEQQEVRYLTAEQFAAHRKEVTQELQKVLDGLSEQKSWPDSVLAALHSPELHELFAQHTVLLRDEAKVFESLEESNIDSSSAAYDSYLSAVTLTSLAERALMEHAAVKRRVRRYNYAHPPPKEGEQDGRELGEEAAALISKHRSTQAEMQVQLAAKLEENQLNLDATKRHVAGYLAQKKELEKAQSK